MKKKIGLLTFHASHNCGSMLQAYALQTILQHLGNDAKIIDFSNSGQRKLYSTWFPNNSLKNAIKNFLIFPHIKEVRKNHAGYENFKSKNFIMTDKKYRQLSELDENELGFSQYICGSDQIWNITIEDSDKAYFLPFVKKHKKIAYAPSFGAKNPAKYAGNELEFYRNSLKNFDFLSIRENNGKKWVKELTGKDIPVVLDPTLVADNKIYSKIEQPIPVPEKFIFYYAPGYMKDLNKFVAEISKKANLPVIVFNARQYYVKRLKKYGFILPREENPGVYLYLMKKAELIFTTSFHGTIFASIYRKKFWTLKNGGMFGDDDRVKTLVKQLNIEDRLILPENPGGFNYDVVPNYEKYSESLTKLRKKSLDFLRDAINAEYEND